MLYHRNLVQQYGFLMYDRKDGRSSAVTSAEILLDEVARDAHHSLVSKAQTIISAAHDGSILVGGVGGGCPVLSQRGRRSGAAHLCCYL